MGRDQPGERRRQTLQRGDSALNWHLSQSKHTVILSEAKDLLLYG
jgi:hypothetical protein